MWSLPWWDNWLSIAASLFTISAIVFAGVYFKDLLILVTLKVNYLWLYKLSILYIANTDKKSVENYFKSIFNKAIDTSNTKIDVKKIYLFLNNSDLELLTEHNYNNLLNSLRYMSDKYAFSVSNISKKRIKRWKSIFISTNKIYKK